MFSSNKLFQQIDTKKGYDLIIERIMKELFKVVYPALWIVV